MVGFWVNVGWGGECGSVGGEIEVSKIVSKYYIGY